MRELRQETIDMFYHGFDNYMNIAFPEDEIRPLSCRPLTRDGARADNIALNDVLGNYSLTLIDSLSTLALFASASPAIHSDGSNSILASFQKGVALLVEYYGDGSDGARGQGLRAKGFDVDSKVQVFETVIRGVGGLLSAHLFAVGDLPIQGYDPKAVLRGVEKQRAGEDATSNILWPNGFTYDGQLLRLAHDLATRLLPAFYTPTGLPYPRVNLRHGIPFYLNSPLHHDAEHGQCYKDPPATREITETCSAGAGSLVLEFTTLSRLTGDSKFEQLGKRAFWEVWRRRSAIGLIGSGIDAESGLWAHPTTGIGAGIDSFFEYAFKTHILLSGKDDINTTLFSDSLPPTSHRNDPNSILRPLEDDENKSWTFLSTWEIAHSAIKRHLHREIHHPHYINANLYTGSPQAFWIDSLGAYYPGLLTLAGHLDEAIETHMLYAALWSRYSALPERWSTRDGTVEGGLGWWPGRPEFIESNYHLYRATRDPWYLHVGEMALRDIKRRCWAKCGWAGLQDVRTGELTDRMESFFLGETAKYLFLLFDPDHPLNHLDAPFVFTTEGHPLILPKAMAGTERPPHDDDTSIKATCPKPPPMPPLSLSAVAARTDMFHAASLARLHLLPKSDTLGMSRIEFAKDHPSTRFDAGSSPTNYTFYPWTLPLELIPTLGYSSRIAAKHSFEIQFPTTQPNIMAGQQSLSRIAEGLVINSMEGIRLGMILDGPRYADGDGSGGESFRIYNVGSFPLGRDEKVFIKKDVLGNMVDPNFTRLRDTMSLEIIVDATKAPLNSTDDQSSPMLANELRQVLNESPQPEVSSRAMVEMRNMISSLLQQFSAPVSDQSESPKKAAEDFVRIPAVSATGVGAAPLPEVEDAPDVDNSEWETAQLPWSNIFLAGSACDGKLTNTAYTKHQVVVIMRGGCSFSQKLANIPSSPPSRTALQLVVVVSDDDDGTRPLLDERQRTPGGLLRRHPIPMVMIEGGLKVYETLARARGVGLKRRYHVRSQGVPVSNLFII
ncbi:MAG: alpha mannosidase-like protein [Piccolia ochrophora]|nr:MAG: alpha mannosidase-like protein [Piccolia ochrophora]